VREGFGGFCVGREFFFMGFKVILGLRASFFDFWIEARGVILGLKVHSYSYFLYFY
jgi:hypothetical protein